jgi:hypothetical protein
MILDGHRKPEMTTPSDGPATAERAAQLSFDDALIVGKMLEDGYFLPSLWRFRSTRRS